MESCRVLRSVLWRYIQLGLAYSVSVVPIISLRCSFTERTPCLCWKQEYHLIPSFTHECSQSYNHEQRSPSQTVSIREVRGWADSPAGKVLSLSFVPSTLIKEQVGHRDWWLILDGQAYGRIQGACWPASLEGKWVPGSVRDPVSDEIGGWWKNMGGVDVWPLCAHAQGHEPHPHPITITHSGPAGLLVPFLWNPNLPLLIVSQSCQYCS